MIALAYVNWGRWLAECPVPNCHDARLLMPEDLSITCANGHMSPVQWPGGAPGSKVVGQITAALADRPEMSTRAWFPAGQPFGQALGAPADQSPEDLIAETDAHAQAASEQRSAMQDIAAAIAGAGMVTLSDLGLTVADDGTLIPAPTKEG